MNEPQEAVYEMLWDCKYCGQKKLLGVTHRFCAGCGGPQDPAARYFPPDNEKVPAKDNVFVGADIACPACRHPMSAAVKNCTNCGSPIAGGQQVALRPDQFQPPPGWTPPAPAQATAPAPAKKSNTMLIILGVVGGIIAIIVTIILVAVFWKREGVFAVSGHTWERDIAIERYDATRKSVWCTDVPAGGRIVSRHSEQKSTTKVPDGQTCSTTKKDQGNGTYKEVQTCTPKYKETPVMADKCDIDVTEWHASRTVTAKGASLTDPPKWPVSGVNNGLCLGCEREGARTEHYTVLFGNTAKAGDTAQCEVPQARWQTMADGSKWKGSVGVMTGTLDCDALQAQ